MVSLSFHSLGLLTLVAILTNVHAAPLTKRIAQVISDSTQQWEKACDAAGGGQQCNSVSVTAFSTLLAAAGPCDQQNSADAMIDLAKQLKNDPNMIKFAQIFAQQARNTPNSLAVPYCQQAPKNSELIGLFQCQFQGSNQTTFVGGLSVGSPGTIPFGLSSPVSPAGSCPANPTGPIADGSQLVDITQDPGLANVHGGSGSGVASGTSSSATNLPGGVTAVMAASPAVTDSSSSDSSSPSSTSAAPVATATDSNTSGCPDNTDPTMECVCDDGPDDGSGGDGDGDDGSVTPTPTPAVTPSVTDSIDTTATPTPTDTPSSSPSVDSPTPTDAPTSTVDPTSAAPAATSSASASSGNFQLQNGKDAQALNAKYATLTADSTCNAGDQACVNGGFAQCVSGKWTIIQCSTGLTCAALPLVNKPGTSIACDSQADILARIQASGASGGITG